MNILSGEPSYDIFLEPHNDHIYFMFGTLKLKRETGLMKKNFKLKICGKTKANMVSPCLNRLQSNPCYYFL